jgi:hypothetical protein
LTGWFSPSFISDEEQQQQQQQQTQSPQPSNANGRYVQTQQIFSFLVSILLALKYAIRFSFFFLKIAGRTSASQIY